MIRLKFIERSTYVKKVYKVKCKMLVYLILDNLVLMSDKNEYHVTLDMYIYIIAFNVPFKGLQ